jgi:glutamate 5-kinase
VDAGAEAALRGGKKSLLPVGVTGVEGRFAPGDLVEVRGPEGRLVGHGLARYSSETMRLLAGMNTEGVRGKLGATAPEEAIHVDYLILAD